MLLIYDVIIECSLPASLKPEGEEEFLMLRGREMGSLDEWGTKKK